MGKVELLPGDRTSPTLEPLRKKEEAGVVYLSRIPPTMTPQELRRYLEPFGRVGRIYLAPDEKTAKGGRVSSKDLRARRRARFTEGWAEFLRKKDAKSVALALNGTMMGGKKSSRFHDDIWNIKYLKGFKWHNLNEAEVYERAVRQQKLRTEISQARKVTAHYLKQAERSHELRKIEEKRAAKQGTTVTEEERTSRQLQSLRGKFRQRTPILKDSGPQA